MRVYKFRAWDSHNNQMLDVQELNFEDCFYGGEMQIKTTMYSDYFDCREMQDIKGTEIYAGDILEYILRNVNGEVISREHYLVKECVNGWELRNIKRPRHHKSLKFCFKYKIIGNIYKNPDLLKAGD